MNTVYIVTVKINETAVTIDFLGAILENISTQSIEVIPVDNTAAYPILRKHFLRKH